MDVLTCIIVEDEPIAAEIIADYISPVPFLECAATFTNPMLALSWLMENKADVIFLDINMPIIKGHDFIRAAKKDYQYIITTAYQEFAVDSYSWGVVDYLLKPVDFARFMSAVSKLKGKNKTSSESKSLMKEEGKRFLYFNVNKNFVKVNIHDILYVESIRDYIKIVTDHQTVMTKGKLSDLETSFREVGIIRIHRSLMINIHKIDSFNLNEVYINGVSLPIGRQYKELFSQIMENFIRRGK